MGLGTMRRLRESSILYLGCSEADGSTRGGAGAGPDWDGQSCVHVHMTNVRLVLSSESTLMV
jgi:hypothetical protein